MHSRENYFELVDLQNNNSDNLQYQDQSLLTQVFKSIFRHTQYLHLLKVRKQPGFSTSTVNAKNMPT